MSICMLMVIFELFSFLEFGYPKHKASRCFRLVNEATASKK